MAEATEIQGYPEFQKALDKMAKELPEQTVKAANQVAKDWVSAARNNAESNQARQAAQALMVQTDREGATLVNDHPLFYGSEFGGQARPSTMQFPPHNGQRGYWLFPAARDNADKFQQVWEAAIDEAMKYWDHKE